MTTQLSNDEKRIRLAESSGLKIVRKGDPIAPGVDCLVRCSKCGGAIFNAMFVRPQNPEFWMCSDHPLVMFTRAGYWDGEEVKSIPDYFTSLDACALLRRSLTDEEKVRYADSLSAILGDNSPWLFRLIDATPEQHCECYARVRNLWP